MDIKAPSYYVSSTTSPTIDTERNYSEVRTSVHAPKQFCNVCAHFEQIYNLFSSDSLSESVQSQFKICLERDQSLFRACSEPVKRKFRRNQKYYFLGFSRVITVVGKYLPKEITIYSQKFMRKTMIFCQKAYIGFGSSNYFF